MTAVLLESFTRWGCPNCVCEVMTVASVPNRFHTCPGLHGLVAPLIREGTDCKVVAVPRGDYLNGDTQRSGDDGQAYMAVETVHADGHTDRAVYAPPAIARVGAT